MGRLFLQVLEGRIYSCRSCHTHLAKRDALISKDFQSLHGNAYLFNDVVNVYPGRTEVRSMNTGLHTVVDITCNSCNRVVGWKYEVAHELTQKYKEGKFILERAKIDFGDWSGIQNFTDVAAAVDSEGEIA